MMRLKTRNKAFYRYCYQLTDRRYGLALLRVEGNYRTGNRHVKFKASPLTLACGIGSPSLVLSLMGSE